MEINLIKIGTSKGIRLPSKILKKFDEPDKFHLSITEYGLFLKPLKSDVRCNWRDEFIKSKNCSLADEYL